MAGVQLEDRLQGGDDLPGARLRPACEGPLVPGPQVEQRLGEEHAHLRVGRVFCPDLAHGIGVGEVQAVPVLRRGVCVSAGERVDQVAFDGRGGGEAGPGELEFPPGPCGGRGWARRVVDVRSARVGDGPVSHRAVRVQCGGLLERTEGGAAVEAFEESESLVEVALRLRRPGS